MPPVVPIGSDEFEFRVPSFKFVVLNSKPETRNSKPLFGWGGWIRTNECRFQRPVPYHLATPQKPIQNVKSVLKKNYKLIARSYSNRDTVTQSKIRQPRSSSISFTARCCVSRLSKIPNTLEPLPANSALCAPAVINADLALLISGSISKITDSKSFSSSGAPRGFNSENSLSFKEPARIGIGLFDVKAGELSARYASAVDTEARGCTTIRCITSASGSRVSVVPVPDPIAEPPCKKNGTSAPKFAAIADKSKSLALSCHSLLRANSVTAALDDPPPSPALAGIRLCRRISTPASGE